MGGTLFNLNKLIKLKNKQKITIGLALPVYNEEKTITKTIKTIEECRKLLDEIIVVDSGSTDNSRAICEKLGIQVISDKKAAQDLDIELQKGKGWNLWASLYYLNTDIIIWTDTDIQNFDKRFITGIVGPMVIDDKIKFVKGYYHRPVGDARVTEIMARPFIDFIFPKVKDFIQPLSGEYGGKREFLEKIVFYSGYSVEMAILIQAMYTLQNNQVAQTYLDSRIHELQSVSSLGRMSASILHTLFRMAQKMKYLELSKKLPSQLQQFESPNGTDFNPAYIEIKDKELPPMIKIKQYRKKFRK